MYLSMNTILAHNLLLRVLFTIVVIVCSQREKERERETDNDGKDTTDSLVATCILYVMFMI